MVLVFGGFLAAGMPIVGAIASIGGALATLLGFSYLIDLDAAVVNVVTVLGLGLCIDYGLLIVSRYREELRERSAARSPPGRPGPPAPSAGRRRCAPPAARCCSPAITVAISLSGLLLFQARILRAVGAAGVSVVVVALLVALTLVPALLALAGARMVRPGLLNRIPGLRELTRRLGDVAPEEGFFSRLARWTQRRPWLVVGGVLLILGILAAPALRLELRSSGAQLLPPSAPDRQFFDTLAEQYPASGHPDHPGGRRRPRRSRWPPLAAGRSRAMDGVELVTPPRAGRRAVRRGQRVHDRPRPGQRRGQGRGRAVRDEPPRLPDLGHRPDRAR